jgi:xylose dehydrogenase (NAD/NADP)
MIPFRLGIVGCGGIAERHAPAAAASAALSIVACCDVRAGVAEQWAGRYGCERAYGDYLTMIREHDLDGILLATWPNLHREQVLGCLDAGVQNILCEKSLALTGSEALEISAAAAASGALVVEGLMYRHHPAIAKIDELLAAEEIGVLDSVSAAFSLFDPGASAPDDPGRDWRQRPEFGGGVPWDLACYCVDACNRFAGALPKRALAVASQSDRYGTTDRLFGLIEYENGVVGMLQSSKRSDFNHELRIAGGGGEIRLPVAWRIEAEIDVLVSRSAGWGEFDATRFSIPASDAFRLQLEAFVRAARGDARPVPTLAESVVDALTLDALLSSAAQQASVPVEVPSEAIA